VRVLGLDPSLTAYGWAVHDDAATGQKRRVASGHEGTLPSTVPVVRFMHFRALVSDLLRRYNVELVGLESPAYQAGPFQRIHFGLMMFSLEAVFEKRLDLVLFDPATLKMLAKGDPAKHKGAMSKMDMQRRVQLDTMAAGVIDNNEADAYLVGKYAARFKSLRDGTIEPSQLEPSERLVFIERTRRVKTMAGVVRKRVAHAFRENSRFFSFSQVPAGQVSLPAKSVIRPEILAFLDSLEASEDKK
jgi:Holliday junction resolvasome RuvABC endonuclease subunit